MVPISSIIAASRSPVKGLGDLANKKGYRAGNPSVYFQKQKWNCLTILRLATTNCCFLFSLLIMPQIWKYFLLKASRMIFLRSCWLSEGLIG